MKDFEQFLFRSHFVTDAEHSNYVNNVRVPASEKKVEVTKKREREAVATVEEKRVKGKEEEMVCRMTNAARVLSPSLSVSVSPPPSCES